MYCIAKLVFHNVTPTNIGVRDGGIRGGSWPPKILADTTFIRAKDNTFVWLTVSPNGTSIHLPKIRFGWGNEGDVHWVLLYDRQQIPTAIVNIFFSLAGPRDKQFVFAIRVKLGLTPKWMLARTPMQTNCSTANGSCGTIFLLVPFFLDRYKVTLYIAKYDWLIWINFFYVFIPTQAMYIPWLLTRMPYSGWAVSS